MIINKCSLTKMNGMKEGRNGALLGPLTAHACCPRLSIAGLGKGNLEQTAWMDSSLQTSRGKVAPSCSFHLFSQSSATS